MHLKVVLLNSWSFYPARGHELTHKQMETHGCTPNTVATDVLVLKHQDISIHSAGYIFVVLDQFHTRILHL